MNDFTILILVILLLYIFYSLTPKMKPCDSLKLVDKKKLLCHIAYYESDKRVDSKNGIDKGSCAWKKHVFDGVQKTINEINKFTAFETIDVVIDVNSENKWVDKLTGACIKRYSFENEHPFLLTTKHRENIARNIDKYDYFMYIEDDTFVPNETMNCIVANTQEAWNRNKVLTLARMVTPLNIEDKKKIFYSDIVKSFVKEKRPKLRAVVPTSRFSASWVYSASIVKEWMKHPSFKDFSGALRDGGIRVDMGIGFKEKEAIVPVDAKEKPLTICFHLGYCGKYYFKHPYGFHTLPL